MQRPNLSYGETKIFDKYFNTLFKNDYLPEDAYALSFWMRKIMDAWTQENPLGLEEELLNNEWLMLHTIFIFCHINGFLLNVTIKQMYHHRVSA